VSGPGPTDAAPKALSSVSSSAGGGGPPPRDVAARHVAPAPLTAVKIASARTMLKRIAARERRTMDADLQTFARDMHRALARYRRN
jgi:hypothetical protein